MGRDRSYLAMVACGVVFALTPSAGWASSDLNWGAGTEVTLPGDAGTNPNPSFNSVSCASAGNCTGVGTYTDGSSHSRGLLLTESAGVWSVGIEAPLPAGANANPGVSIHSVSCPSAGSCTAVGSYQDSSSHAQGLLLTQSSGGWTAATAPLPGDAVASPGVSINSVSCPSVGNCTAVGHYQNASGQQGLLLSESSGSWTAAKLTPPGDVGGLVGLDSVSCASAGNCVAIGGYRDNLTRNQPLFATETSGSWSPGAQPPRPAGALLNGGDGLASVSCPAAGNCSIVGGYYDSSVHVQGLLLNESAGMWTALKASLPSDAATDPSVSLASVSCVSAGDCSAVGDYNNGTHAQGLLLTKSSGTWGTGVAMALPAGSAPDAAVSMGSVSCVSAGNCGAVGDYETATTEHALLLQQSAGTWRTAIEPTNPSNAATTNPEAELDVASCPSAGNCVALGDYEDSSGHFQGLLATAAPVSPALSLTAPSSGSVGTAIPGSSLGGSLSGGLHPTGTISFKVFGPQASPPSSCGSGGTTIGSATVSGNGTYHPSAGLIPSRVGNYWWYASYGGDTSDKPAASPCGAGMAETVVTALGKLKVTHVSISGSTVNVTLRCSGPAGARCPASGKLRARLHRKMVVVARATTNLAAGRHKTLHLKLNKPGRKLLAKFGHIKVKLTITEGRKTVFTKKLGLPARRKH